LDHRWKFIKTLKELTEGHKFSEAFKSEQSDDDMKLAKMVFSMTTEPSLSSIRKRHRKLIEHLQPHQMCLDKSLSGSDDEELVEHFMGSQAEKTFLTGFADDLCKLVNQMKLQPGEQTMMEEAKQALTWSNVFPPFCSRVRNISLVHDIEQCASKAIGITTAKEHLAFFKMLLSRAQEEEKMNGLG
jgi:hypothetical protein